MPVQQSTTFTLTIVVDSVLQKPAGSLPTALVGAAYTANLATSPTTPASGGDPPYSFSGVAGLPPGLTVDGAGNITGTPTASGSYTITGTITETMEP